MTYAIHLSARIAGVCSYIWPQNISELSHHRVLQYYFLQTVYYKMITLSHLNLETWRTFILIGDILYTYKQAQGFFSLNLHL